MRPTPTAAHPAPADAPADAPVDPEVLASRASFDARSSLEELVCEGARRMLQAAIDAEVYASIDAHADRRDNQLRIRHQQLWENFAWPNRFTLSLLRQHPAKMSQAMKRCGWSDDFLLQVVTRQGSSCALALGRRATT
ncbi:MAG: hypothetical protein R3B90_22890 [Planctomycetaceae bacterium]